MTALVSTIVPVYNGERYLPEALDSVLAQTYQNVEIIIVDDGSTDSSRTIAEKYASLHPRRIRVLHQTNGGTGAARNAAMAAAHGRYIAMLDQDDLWTPLHLAEAVAVLEDEPSVGLVHANIQILEGNADSFRLSPRSTSSIWRDSGDAFTTLLLRRAHIACLTAVFRRSLVESLGGFDPSFYRLGNDDRDMWLRISKIAGIRYLDSIHGAWRRHDDNQSGNYERMRRGQFLLVDRHAVGPHRHLRNKAMAAIYVETGYDQLHREGARGKSVVSCARALSHYPFSANAWKGLANAVVSLSSRRNIG